MTIKITITTNIATEYTCLNKILSKYAMIIRKRISTYTDEELTPASKSIITLKVEKSEVLRCLIQDLKKIKNLNIKF